MRSRRLGIGRRPLRRRTDRLEAVIMALLLGGGLLAGPGIVWSAAQDAHHNARLAIQRDSRIKRFHVTAVLTDDAADHYIVGDEPRPAQGPVPARWSAPDGTPRTGSVVPPTPGLAGSRVVIDTDAHGNPLPPPRRYDPAGRAAVAAFLTTLALFAVIGGLLLAVRRWLDRQRMARWSSEWTAVEPLWSGRRRSPPAPGEDAR